MTFSLGRAANGWNEVAKTDREYVASLRREFMTKLTSQIIGETTGAEFKVLAAITARTLRFRKFAEAISVIQLRTGLRDMDNSLIADDNGPYFVGCNISKDETISRAIDGLETKGLITRWRPGRRGWSAVYMPFSERWLAQHMARELGGLPESYDGYVEGQILWGRGQLVRIVGGPLRACVVQPVDSHLQEVDEPWTVSLLPGDTAFETMTPVGVRAARGRPQYRASRTS